MTGKVLEHNDRKVLEMVVDKMMAIAVEMVGKMRVEMVVTKKKPQKSQRSTVSASRRHSRRISLSRSCCIS